jgi:hypothetical protein
MWNDTITESVRRTKLSRLDLSGQGMPAFDLNTNNEKRMAIDAIIRWAKYLRADERSNIVRHIADEADVALPDDLMMISNNIVEMRAAGMQIGAHTVTHPILARIDDRKAEEEISVSKAFLESLLGERVRLFAYPNGKFGQDWLSVHATIVRRLGFDAAVSTSWGVARRESDPMQLPRFTPWNRTRATFALALARNVVRRS